MPDQLGVNFACSEIARMVQEYKNELKLDESSLHEDNAFQKRFSQHVANLYNSMTCNPFEQTNLSAINDTSVRFDEFVVNDIKRVVSGKLQFDKFWYERLILPKVAVSDVIKKNNLNLMGNITHKNKSKDVSLITQMITKLRAANITRENLVAMLFESEFFNTAQSTSNDSRTLHFEALGTKSTNSYAI